MFKTKKSRLAIIYYETSQTESRQIKGCRCVWGTDTLEGFHDTLAEVIDEVCNGVNTEGKMAIITKVEVF